MKTKYITVLSIAACALIVPTMIYFTMSASMNAAPKSAPLAVREGAPSTAPAVAPPVATNAVAATSTLSVTNVRVRATVPGARVSAAYMDITSPQPLTLTSANAKIAGITEIHSMAMRGGVMEMRALEQLPIPANTVVKLERGGLHMMLLQLNAQINAGDKVPLTLMFEDADGKQSSVDVVALAEGLEKNATSSGSEHKH